MRRLFLMVCMSLMAIMASAQTKIKVEVHNVVALDEVFSVSFVIEGGRPSDFEWDPGEDFVLMSGPQMGTFSSTSNINGKRESVSQTLYSYALQPVKAGKFTLPTAHAVVKGKDVFSEKTTIEVISGASSQAKPAPSQNTPNPSSEQKMFMVMSLDRTNVVIGEPIKAVLKLYHKVNIAGFDGSDFPDFDGFWSHQTYAPANLQFVREKYEDQIYNSAVLREYILIPQRTGKIVIDPAELVCLVSEKMASRSQNPFDSFFDEYVTVRKKLTTRPVTVNVSPLPQGAPESFAGGVGKFSFSTALSTDSLSTHDAASLILKVNGTGNVSLLETPKISFPLDIEAYDPKVTSDVDENGLYGTKVYEYPFIPRSAGDFELGPIQYTYYDINQRKYVTIDAGTLSLKVTRGNQVDEDPVIAVRYAGQKVENRGSDIRHICSETADFAKKGMFFLGSTLFWSLTVAILFIALLLWIVLRKLAARRADVVGMKNRKATKMALKRLHFAGTLLKKNLYSAFYEELHNALLGYMSDKLNMPISELSKERMSEVLLNNGVLPAYVTELVEILDSCEYARYAPSSGNQAMTSDYEKAVEVISSIDSAMKTKKGISGKVLAMLFMLLPAAGLNASEVSGADQLWQMANAAYEQGEWAAAADAYTQISDMGLESAQLYYNMGNAYFRQEELAKAVLYYERALKLDPSYEDARFNLDYVNSITHDKIEVVPEFFVKEWLRNLSEMMSSNAWAVTFLVLLALTLALLMVFRLSPVIAWRRVGFFAGLVTLLLMFAALAFSLWQKNDYDSHDQAVVMVTVTMVKSSPSADNSTDLFVLHEGTKVNILDMTGDWTKISLADGRQGWIKTSEIEEI